MTEDAIQEAIVNYLRAVLAKKIVLSIPNEGKRSPASAARLRRMGMRKGAPDLLLVIGGKAFFFEVKSAKGRVRDEQFDFQVDADIAGAGWAIVRSIDDVRRALAHWKIPTREVVEQ